MNLATAFLDPALRVDLPNRFADPDRALDYWLSNPLLLAAYPRRMAATIEQLPALSSGARCGLIARLEKATQKLREPLARDMEVYNELLSLIRNPLVDMAERNSLKPHLLRLRGPELTRERQRIEQAIQARENAAFEQWLESAA